MESTITEQHDAQEWERQWWGACLNTFGEEAKQISYAHRMGLINTPFEGKWPVYDLAGASVLDIGGGPVSMLLKTMNRGPGCAVVDPCKFPAWVGVRYQAAGIDLHREPAEAFVSQLNWDEAWIYNCLQHTQDPEMIIEMVRECCQKLRIFEWIETETNVGHPHSLHADELNAWIGNGAVGTVEMINENGAHGLCYHGVFEL